MKSDERQVLNPLSIGGGKTLVKKLSVIKLTNDESEVRVIKVSVSTESRSSVRVVYM